MNTLLAMASQKLNNLFSLQALRLGTYPLIAANRAELGQKLKDAQILLMDTSIEEYAGVEVLENIQKESQTTALILFMYASSMSLMRKFRELGVFGVISKGNPLSHQQAVLSEYVQIIKSQHKEKRYHTRIDSDLHSINITKISIPGIRIQYNSKVVNISFQGTSLLTEHLVSNNIIFKGKVVHLSFQIEEYSFQAEAVVIAKQQKQLALIFSKMSLQAKHELSRYILHRIFGANAKQFTQ